MEYRGARARGSAQHLSTTQGPRELADRGSKKAEGSDSNNKPLIYQKASPGQRSEGGARHSPCSLGAQKEGALPQLPIVTHEWVDGGQSPERLPGR